MLAQPGSPLSIRAMESGIPTIEFPMRGEFDIQAIRKIREITHSNQIQIVHTHTAHAHSLAALAKSRSQKWKLLAARRVDFRLGKNPFSKWKYKSSRTDYIVCVSRKILEYLMEDGIDPGKLITIHSGIDIKSVQNVSLPEVNSLKKKLGIPKSTIIIGNVAALVDHKDQITLLESISKIASKQNFCLLILGSGPLQEELEKKAASLNIAEKVKFLGFQSPITQYWRIFDIFALTSKEEGLGTSILDAMSAGIPVVATRAGGIPELVSPDKGGYLSEIGDSDSIGEQLGRLISNEELRKEMGRFNLEKVKSFSIEHTVEKTIQLYYSFMGDILFPPGNPNRNPGKPEKIQKTTGRDGRSKPQAAKKKKGKRS